MLMTYTYDNTGRMSAVGCGDLSFEYSRVTDTDRISQIVAKNNTVTVHTAARTYSPFGELLSQSGYAYTLDSDGRRTAAAFDGKNWAYSYDGLNQLTGAALTEGATPLSSHAYSYDEIGNRLTSTLNGVTTSYTANDLNQYTAVGNVTPTYDDDGNMLTDGTMTYQYDVMNQLISAETAAEKYTFMYDFEGRRYEAKKWTKNGDAWTPVQTVKYVYDEWNVIAEYVNGVKVKNYVWGEDLSGTMQGAGGVGGLLAEINASGTYLPVCDGNGNILSYKDLSGNTAATYVYGPFGSVLSHTGTDFAYKFSTKPETCGLYYYGFRYYSPALGRWINRDTLKESVSQNLYCFVSNDPVDAVDVLGAWGWLKSIFENQAQYHQRMNELDNLAQKNAGFMFFSMLGYRKTDDCCNGKKLKDDECCHKNNPMKMGIDIRRKGYDCCIKLTKVRLTHANFLHWSVCIGANCYSFGLVRNLSKIFSGIGAVKEDNMYYIAASFDIKSSKATYFQQHLRNMVDQESAYSLAGLNCISFSTGIYRGLKAEEYKGDLPACGWNFII